MNYRWFCCVLFTLTSVLNAAAQAGKPSGGAPINRNPGISQPNPNIPDQTSRQPIFLTGKVVLDDGSELTDAVNLQTICRGQRQTVAHTDFHGNFSFELSGQVTALSSGISDASDDLTGSTSGRNAPQRDWRECELQASLPGFSSQSIDLGSRLFAAENVEIGHLVLHRMGHVQGLTISATSAMAPKDAQKAYAKGSEKARKEKWDEAQPLFAKAVEIYPRYAVAWFELGRIQLRKKAVEDARHSFEQSIAADSKYVNPYRGLAELDTEQQQWPALAKVTAQITALNPVSFPDAWLSNAVANYYLHNFAEAEKSARQGMKMDDQHHVQKLEYLLGLILIQEREYAEATTHIQNYIKIAQRPADIEDARKQLAEVDRLLASAANPAAGDEKK